MPICPSCEMCLDESMFYKTNRSRLCKLCFTTKALRRYYRIKRKRWFKEKHPNKHEEYEICAWFGCSKPLSIHEKLCGNKCFEHMNNKVALFNNGKQ